MHGKGRGREPPGTTDRGGREPPGTTDRGGREPPRTTDRGGREPPRTTDWGRVWSETGLKFFSIAKLVF